MGEQKFVALLRDNQPCVKLAMMDTQSRRSLTTLTKSAKLLAAQKRSKIAAKPKAKGTPKRKLAALDGYLIADEKKLGKYLDLMPEAYEELRRFLPCVIERLGPRRVALIPFVNADCVKVVLVSIECNPATIAAGKAVAEVIIACGPKAGLSTRDVLLTVGASADVSAAIKRAKANV